MRLAILTIGTYPIQTHGAEIGIFYVARELATKGYQVSLYVSEPTRNRTPVEKLELPKNMKIVHSSGLPLRFVYNLSFVTATISRFRSRGDRPALVVVNVPTLLSLATAYFAKLAFKIRFVVIVHGPPDLEIKLPVFRKLQSLLIRRAGSVVCVSKELARIVANRCRFDYRMIALIPNGYDESEIREALKATVENVDMEELIFVGSLDENKDPLTLIRSFKLVSDSKPHALLNIVGSGPLEAKVRELVAVQGLKSRVTFHSSMRHAELLALIARSALLVMTSHREGFPTVVLEALALGKPVVATRVGGLPELIKNGENGFLVPLGDEVSLAQNALRILDDSNLRTKLSLEAKRSVLNYTWNRITKRYENLFDSLTITHDDG